MSQQKATYSNTTAKPGKTKAFFICLIIASFLWLAHSLNTVYTYTFKIPVTFKNIPQNKRPLVEIPKSLTLDVKASGLKLAIILFSKPFKGLEIDFNLLGSSGRQQNNYVLSSARLDFTKVFKFETQIKRLSPDTLYFSEKTGYQKNVPVKVPYYLKCKEGYGFKKPQINPTFVTIWGDTNTMNKIDTIYTQPLNLSELFQNVKTSLSFIKPNQNIYTNTNEASVIIEVNRLIEQIISIPVSDIRKGQQREVSIFPGRVKIKFTAIQNAVSANDTTTFVALIDSEKPNAQTKKCPVFLGTIPGGVTVMSVEPREVEVLIFKK